MNPFINVTIPVYNEERDLRRAVTTLANFLRLRNERFEIVIADNASTDGTSRIAAELAKEHSMVRNLRLAQKGRGCALKKAWSESEAEIVSYMDCDLSTDLRDFEALISPLVSGACDISVGSRLLKNSSTVRGFKRSLISKGYNLLVKAFFQTHFSDAQCGFKALRRESFCALSPFLENDGWFLDSEILILAEKHGFRICDLPVRWVDDSDSRVEILSTAKEDILELIRLKRNFLKGRYTPLFSRGASLQRPDSLSI